MTWDSLAAWWVEEVSTDPAYEAVVTPLLVEVLEPQAHHTYVDLGSGEGRVMRALGDRNVRAIGIEGSEALATASTRPVVVARLPQIPLRGKCVDGCYCVLVLEHLEDHRSLFREAARVTEAGGVLVLISNHPAWTAPGSTPVTDSDGEILWRPGEYFSNGSSQIPADGDSVVFHHRTISDLLNAAADHDWSLERVVERPHHDLSDQAGIPRLLACRWRLLRDAP